jgi:hypothetical protein
MTDNAGAMTEREREQALLYPEALRELHRGHPRAFIEGFLSVEDKVTGQVVPFLYTANQRVLDGLMFQGLSSYLDPLEWVILKDRQATVSSKLLAVLFSLAVNIPAVHAVHVFQDERTGDMLKKRLELYWRSLPGWFFNHDGMGLRIDSSRKDYMEVGFYAPSDAASPQAVSSVTIVSASAEEFGSGISPSRVVYDEYDLYRDLDLVGRIDAGLGQNAWRVKASTPRGLRYLHQDYWAIRDGAGGHAVALYCFMNPQNRLEEGHIRAPQAYRGRFEHLPEHRRIVESAEWGAHSVHKEDQWGFLRWWEWERQMIRQRLAAQGVYNEKRVLDEMEQDHLTNDQLCWMTLSTTPFDAEVLERCRKRAQAGARADGADLSGARRQIWRTPQPGMAYACPMDCAEGYKLGDELVAYVRDADGNYAACLSGHVDLAAFTKDAVRLCRLYNDALFAPEVDGGLGLAAISIARDMGYTNIWRVPPKETEDGDRMRARPFEERYGWRTQGQKQEMKQRGIMAVNAGDASVWDMALIRDMSMYDPDSQRHTSDRLMAFFIGEMITRRDGHRFGAQFWGQARSAGRPAARLAEDAERDLAGVRAMRERRGSPSPAGAGIWGVPSR